MLRMGNLGELEQSGLGFVEFAEEDLIGTEAAPETAEDADGLRSGSFSLRADGRKRGEDEEDETEEEESLELDDPETEEAEEDDLDDDDDDEAGFDDDDDSDWDDLDDEGDEEE